MFNTECLTFYIRYADDFVVFSQDREILLSIIPKIQEFLRVKLKCSLHDRKVFVRKLSSGMDFLGWTHFPKHRVLRTVAKKRMYRNLKNTENPRTLSSYLGLLKHGNARKIKEQLMALYKGK